MADTMDFAKHPSPSSPKSCSFFFRSDSGVDAESMVGAGATGGERVDFIDYKPEPNPQGQVQGQLLDKKEPLPVKWIWPN